MKVLAAILLMTLAAGPVAAADGAQAGPEWRLTPLADERPTALQILFPKSPLGFGSGALPGTRPRLSVALSPAPGTVMTGDMPSFSWSLEAWEMNTASLAHIQCSRATRTIESFLVEDCRFVDRPVPSDSPSLVQVRGQWLAAPGLSISAGIFSGRDSLDDRLSTLAVPVGLDHGSDEIQGINFNVSFGLRVGQIGDLLLDLQLERYRRTPAPFSSALDNPSVAAPFGQPAPLPGTLSSYSRQYGSAGQIGLGWRGRSFGADLTGEYQELPYWLGSRLQGEGFRSFDLEFSWRAPARSSISVGVSNVLDRLPGAATRAAEQRVEETVDGIYGRIPYVRYKHDL